MVAIEAEDIRLDDGTAEALIVLGGDAAGLAGSLQPGDALNATGTPELRDEPVLVVNDIAGIELVGDLGGAAASDPAPAVEAASLAAGDGPSAAPLRAAFATGLGLDSVSTGLGTLVLVGIASVAATLARRERGRRLLRARIVARLEALGRSLPGAQRGGRTGRSEAELGARSGPRSGAARDPLSPDRGPNGG